jgi:hypothetical protein
MQIQLAAESHVPCFQERVGTCQPGYMIPVRLPWRLRARPSATLHEIQVRPCLMKTGQTCVQNLNTSTVVLVNRKRGGLVGLLCHSNRSEEPGSSPRLSKNETHPSTFCSGRAFGGAAVFLWNLRRSKPGQSSRLADGSELQIVVRTDSKWNRSPPEFGRSIRFSSVHRACRRDALFHRAQPDARAQPADAAGAPQPPAAPERIASRQGKGEHTRRGWPRFVPKARS